MLHRKYRTTSGDIKDLAKSGKRIHSPSVSFLYKKSEKETRIGCSVSKKTATNATARNKLKRRCREVLREAITQLPDTYIGLVSIKRVLPFNDLKKEIETLFKRI